MFASWTIVAAFQLPLAAAGAVSDDVPVPGGTAAFAASLAIDPVPDRARFMFEVTRLVHDSSEIRNPATAAFLLTLAQANKRDRRDRAAPEAGPADLVPVPLTAETWSSAVFRRKVAREELVAAIVADRAASLLCHGLAALDDETLEYFTQHGSVLTRLVERSAPAFAAFSNSVRIRANRVIPPGGDGAAALWEAVVGEKVTRPDRFITQLFELSEGRVAYLFDTIGQLDGPRRAFALGLWMPNQATRLERFKALATIGVNSYREWHVRTQPYGRASHDLGMTLTRVTADDGGMPVAPASRAFWSRLFGSNDLPDDGEREVRGLAEDPFDAAWLTETIGSSEVRQRVDRLDQIAFAQRVFGDHVADRGDVFIATRALARYRMLMLTLERIGITQPAVFTAVARHAARVGSLNGHRGFIALAQLQGAVALVARMTAVHTIDVAAAQKLLQHLVALPLNDDGRYAGGVALWMRDALVPAVPGAADTEKAIVAALSGPPAATIAATRLTWEGQRYKLDLGAAERRRLQTVREKQAGLPLDTAVDIADLGRALAAANVTTVEMQTALERITALASRVPERARREEEDAASRSLAPAPEAQAILRKAAEDLARAIGGKDVKRAGRIAAPLLALSDDLLSQTLLSFAYAVNLGDPDGTILLADDVSRRHDFGFGGKDSEQRARAAWALPRQDVAPGVPWHVSGSLLGLDVALAPLALRRLSSDRIVEAPRLTSNQRDAFAVSTATMNPFALTDDQRDAIVDGIERGRRRLASLSGPEDLEAVAGELAMEGARRRALAWTLANDRSRLESMVSLTELLVLGGARLADLDAWGMSMLTTAGCLCARLTPPGRWSTLSGRPQLGATAAGMADVNLQVAVLLKQLQLPAALARVVLSAAMQDFIDEARPTDDADWITLARTARTITAEQVEDYAAAATATGPLVPEEPPSEAPAHRQ
jgi:hypothetical protein